MPTVPSPTPTQRPPRAERQQIAGAQVADFKRQLYQHELNLTRLNALPADLRGEDHADVVAGQQRDIARLQSAIDSTQAAITGDTAP